MSLTILPPELLHLIVDEVTDTYEARVQPLAILKALYDIARTSQTVWNTVSCRMYCHDVQWLRSSALVWAATTGNMSTVKSSLAQGGNPRATNHHLQPPLWLAARNGHKEVVEVLLNYGADIEIRSPTGLTPLAIASREGRDEVMELLLHRGAKVDTETTDHSTPLLWALRTGATDAVTILLSHGAKLPKPRTRQCRRWALAALAVGPDRWTHIPEIKLLMESGRNAEMEKHLWNSTLPLSLQHQLLAISRFLLLPKNGTPTEHIAAHCDRSVSEYGRWFDTIQDLPSRWSRSPKGTPLWWAVYHGEEDLVEQLLKIGAPVNGLVRSYNQTRQPNRLLSLALIRGFPGIAELLVEYGADPNYELRAGDTPLIRAVQTNNLSLASTILRQGGKLEANKYYHHHAEPLKIAVGMQNVQMVRLLLLFGACPNVEVVAWRKKLPPRLSPPSRGRGRGRGPRLATSHRRLWQTVELGSMLIYATRRGNKDVVDILKEFGAVEDIDSLEYED
ncbi:hypothetical protein N7474_000880 [Penicillium riverlandense]|uniref:uncharacterized protein n=1 Tax=Penicillium riverlandense TaxID=1903569 RepID=UPI002547FEAF|nr:uncharacterized protein N7474_000880 [Penicillium riverlandense]KAJ5832569.1 hypothetical protein N7474_000880 [Penicillium riverlandense]